MTERPTVKTWRFLLAAEGAVDAALRAAEEEGLNNLVRFPLNQCGLYLAAALTNVEVMAPPEPVEPEGVTNRGFPIWTSGSDAHGHDWRLQESSRAMVEGEPHGPWLWLFIADERDLPSPPHCTTPDHLHLDVTDAIKLRDGLSAWINDVAEAVADRIPSG